MDVSATGECCALPAAGFLRFFKDMPDPRAGNRVHQLGDMIAIAVMAVICGADGWVHVETFAKAKRQWLATFLDLSNGIPSHDTFGRVFSLLDPDAFERCFKAWMAELVKSCGGKLIAIDGKAIRRSFRHAWDKSGMAHVVSAFVRENSMVFGQLAVEDKSNEITAIPKLLDLMDIKGAVVTVDAMGCQRDIAAKIVDGGADFILAVKDNQKGLAQAAQRMMNDVALDHAKRHQSKGAKSGMNFGFHQSVDGDHGRIETRRVFVSDSLEALGPVARDWNGLGSVVMVESVREMMGAAGTSQPAATTVEHRLYISSIKGCDAARMGDLVRGHWSVENNLHWQLDITFREDERRIRKGHGAENYSRLCRLALNLLKKEKTLKGSIQTKRLNAGWNPIYLIKLMST
jgi:predicted transposase YbfD/YdcC